MNKVYLLEALKARTEEAFKDLLLPGKPTKEEPEAAIRVPNVYLARLPDGKRTSQFAPYVIHTIINSSTRQYAGRMPETLCNVRSIFCTYNPDEQEGGLALLNMMERLRIALLRDPILGGQCELDREGGIEDLVYPDDTAPFFLGEMMSVWALPSVRREVLEIR